MNLPMGLLLACTFAMTSATANADPKPIKPVDHVDLDRFMGDWYVIATIPTWFEKEAYDAVETYSSAGRRPCGDLVPLSQRIL